MEDQVTFKGSKKIRVHYTYGVGGSEMSIINVTKKGKNFYRTF